MNIEERYNLWLANAEDEQVAKYLNDMRDKPQEIKESFYKDLQFGTAGLRGILGAGTNRMNIYTVAQATQGFSKYIVDNFKNPSVAIAYDSRNMSKEFAEISAAVFAGNGIKVNLFKELMPTPVLSYAVRELKCSGGVVVTASHNPAKYNGYKAYNNEGCQIDGEIADKIVTNIKDIDIFSGIEKIPFEKGLETGQIEYISEELCEKYLRDILSVQLNREITKNTDLSVVYTPLYGAGYKLVLTALEKIGIKNLYIIDEQKNPNGNFPTCPYPNPEFKEALKLGLDLAKEKNADILIASDPDADRIGTAVKDNGKYKLLTGDEVGILLFNYICKGKKEDNKMPPYPVAIKSVVSSKMIDAIGLKEGVRIKEVLTGFKNIGEYMKELETIAQDEFIFAYEESCGYLSHNFARDKDAVNASAIFVEMAAWYKEKGISVAEALDNLYKEYGYYISRSVSYEFAGIKGELAMAEIMRDFREKPLTKLRGQKVVKIVDYLNSTVIIQGEKSVTSLPKTNMLEYIFEDESSIMVRPSGTEPKIKFYYFTKADTKVKAQSNFEIMNQEISNIIEQYK